jgi:hypothetical protein
MQQVREVPILTLFVFNHIPASVVGKKEFFFILVDSTGTAARRRSRFPPEQPILPFL